MSLRPATIIIVILVLATIVVLGQGDSEKMWDEAMHLVEQAIAAFGEERIEDGVELYGEALSISRELGQRTAEGLILNGLGDHEFRLVWVAPFYVPPSIHTVEVSY